jgi:hypothetical protein
MRKEQGSQDFVALLVTRLFSEKAILSIVAQVVGRILKLNYGYWVNMILQ